MDRSLKSTKMIRKEKTLLLMKKNRQVFAEREEPDFDSMNSFRPNRGNTLEYRLLCHIGYVDIAQSFRTNGGFSSQYYRDTNFLFS